MNQCPIHSGREELQEFARLFRDECGNPQVGRNKNDLGGIPGQEFLMFLDGLKKDYTDFQDTDFDKKTHIFQTYNFLLISEVGKKIYDTFFSWVYKKYDFTQDNYSMRDFTAFIAPAIQAYDEIIGKTLKECKNKKEAYKKKKEILKILKILATVPNKFQMDIIKELSGKTSFQGIEGVIQEVGSSIPKDVELDYGNCPALEDKTLEQSFNIIFEIYVQIFFPDMGRLSVGKFIEKIKKKLLGIF